MITPTKMKNSLIKRIFDVVCSFACLIIFSIPIILIIIVLLFTQGSPIFFKQLRPGLHEKPFELIKFRTMTQDPNQFIAENMQKSDDQRLTKIGKMLRSTSLDELPSLINVLKGEMSMVGPRPLLMHYLKLYTTEQSKRHNARPGITGWAQINGRNSIPWEMKLELDVWYTENQSIILDIKILLLTLKKVFLREGIGSPGESTGQEFKGQK